MSNNRLGRLISYLRQERPSMERLARLEGSVWRRIDERRLPRPRNRLEDWASRILTPEHRWASLSATALSAVLVVGLGGAWVQPPSVATALNLQIFTSDAASPVYVLLRPQGKGAS